MYSPRELIWITWEGHRRTNELSKALGVKLFEMLYDGNYLVRVFLLSIRTTVLLLSLRPRRVIVQNPSMALTAVVCFLKSILGYKVIVDRHSNFKFQTRTSKKLKYKVFHYLSRCTIRRADLTIVTNRYLKDIVEKWGGDGFVLQDKLPEFRFAKSSAPHLIGNHNITYICSFSDDEPVDEVIEAARLLDKALVIYVTGNPQAYLHRAQDGLPENVAFTGFLPDEDFQMLLRRSDAVMVLTKDEHLLVCGAYEAVCLGKPLILSNTRSLREYFRGGPVFTNNNALDIAQAIQSLIEHKADVALKMRELRGKLEAAWTLKFNELVGLLGRQ